MSSKTARRLATFGFFGGVALGAHTTVFAENAPPTRIASAERDAEPIEEIVVTARRKDELLQDIPLSVNAVSGNATEKLNITRFEDINSVVPGLALQSVGDGFTFRASLRGVGYDSISSLPANVEFYINDALVSPFSLFQSMYDVGQVEVLRGPQGTLRGRAAPSGQITVTTRKPDLEGMGGYALISGTTKDAVNGSAAINIPLISGIAAARLAGVIDDNDVNQVHPATANRSPASHTKSGRISVRVDPIESLSADVMFQYLHRSMTSFQQAESISLSEPGAPLGYGGNQLISATDRLAVTSDPTTVDETQHLTIGNVGWRFAGQQLSYVGSYFTVDSDSRSAQDVANIFPGHSVLQLVPVTSSQQTHELRLSSEERLFGMLDYTVGGVHVKTIGHNPVTSPTVLAIAAPVGTPGFPRFVGIANTNINGMSDQTETSGFGNLTAHLGESTEVSGGLRYISFRDVNYLAIVAPPTTLQNQDKPYHSTVYNFSVSHRFSEQYMAYASTGSSWRKGTSAIGIFRPLTPRLNQYVNVQPEKSKSYEIGMKTNFLERKLDLNVAAFHQKFDGFLYRNPAAVNFVNLNFNATTGAATESLGGFNFLANVPATVNGFEVQATYRPISRFYVDAQASFAKGKINNGVVPCNDVNGDGVPDAAIPTLAQIKAASGGEAVAVCPISDRVSNAPDWSLNLQSEYSQPIVSGKLDAFVRGLLSYFPNNPNDPTNPFDSVSAYALFNLYWGLHSPDGAWELALFGKNITNTQRTLTRGGVPMATSALDVVNNFTSVTFRSNYVAISETPPREFGMSVRYAFGTR
jgi:iron complex outermembrane receptor protein